MLYTDLVRLCPDQLTEAINLMEEKELRLRTPLEELDLLMSLATSLATEQCKDEQNLPTLTTNVDLLTPLATKQHGDMQEQDIPMLTTNVDLLTSLATKPHCDKDEENLSMLSTEETTL